MIEAITNLTNNIKNLDAGKIAINLLFKDEIRQYVLDLNRIDQLFDEGIDSEGNILGEYTYNTEVISKGRKRAGSNYTLYDTGAFYKSFDVAVYSDKSFTIDAETIKEDGTDLARKFGKNILGLSGANLNKLIDKILPLIIIQIREELNK